MTLIRDTPDAAENSFSAPTRPNVAVSPDLSPARSRLLLLLAMATGAVLRLVNLPSIGLNSDEVVYAGQAASLAGNPVFVDVFPVFRAHPMLLQSLLSVIYAEGEHDVAGRSVIALFGVATIGVVYLLGRELYARWTGVTAAALLAVMPYHVIVSRQVLLDGPMVFFATLTLLCLARFARTQHILWMLAAGGAMGLTALTKESSLVLLGCVYAFLALTPAIRRPIRSALAGLAVVGTLFAVHPVTQNLAGSTKTGSSYLVYQLLRRPNHGWEFYAVTVPWAVGPLVLLAAAIVFWRNRSQLGYREVLLVCWIAVPVLFFEVWPVKGYQYLLPIAPALAVLAARGLLRLPVRSGLRAVPLRPRAIAVAVVLASLLAASVGPVLGSGSSTFLAGTGGVPGGREAGRWIRENTPEGATVLTVGPSMSNIVKFYGHRPSFGLSVSPNPLHRNPAYPPLYNPDRQMKQGDLQYVVWDSFSAARSPHFSDYLLQLTDRYHGRVVHTEYIDSGGRREPVIVVYAVRP
jgi:4-amino-4-deoxy-L-arabinose transferase-like glycosyltransferase